MFTACKRDPEGALRTLAGTKKLPTHPAEPGIKLIYPPEPKFQLRKRLTVGTPLDPVRPELPKPDPPHPSPRPPSCPPRAPLVPPGGLRTPAAVGPQGNAHPRRIFRGDLSREKKKHENAGRGGGIVGM